MIALACNPPACVSLPMCVSPPRAQYKHMQPYLAAPPDALRVAVQAFLKPHTHRLLRLLESKGYAHQASRAAAMWPTLRE